MTDQTLTQRAEGSASLCRAARDDAIAALRLMESGPDEWLAHRAAAGDLTHSVVSQLAHLSAQLDHLAVQLARPQAVVELLGQLAMGVSRRPDLPSPGVWIDGGTGGLVCAFPGLAGKVPELTAAGAGLMALDGMSGPGGAD